MSFPAIDPAGVQLRSLIRPTYFSDVESLTPGYTAQSIATNTSTVYSQMRKRYGGQLPWGKTPPALVASGVAPPAVALAGIPTLGSMIVLIQITTPGPLGTAVFQWSSNNGVSFTSNVPTAASVALGTTGLSALFPVGNYDTTDAYAAAPPVPETILRWLTDLVTEDVAIRHGINSNDPLWTKIDDRVKLTRQQIEQAANTKDGLWDLPVSEDLGSAVDTGGPRGVAQASPYSWTYQQARAARREFSGGCTICGQSPCVCRNGLVGG